MGPIHLSPKTKTRWKLRLKKIPGLVWLTRLLRILVNPDRRSEWRLKHTRPDKLFQPYATTAFNRHPCLFSYIREHIPDGPDVRILSFGCSTGEEVFSIRHYFPQAEIVGIDINPRNISICRKKLQGRGDHRIRFVLAGTPAAEPESSFDAVFCMSVLRHGELGAKYPLTCEHLIQFASFEKTVASLCRLVRMSGYLILWGSNFRFSDTAMVSGFDAVFSFGARAPRADTPLYGTDNRWLRGTFYNDAIFRKKKMP